MVSVNYQTYKNLVKQNFEGSDVAESKVAMLGNLRKTLRIADEEHQQIIDQLKVELGGESPAQETPAVQEPTESPDQGPQRVEENPAVETPAVQEPAESPAQGPQRVEEPVLQTPPSIPEPSPAVHSLESRVAPTEEKETPSVGGIHRIGDTPTPQADATPSEDVDVDSASPEQLLQMGKDAFRGGDYQKAYDLCNMALAKKPNFSQALFFKKRAKSKIGDVKTSAPAPASTGSSDPMLSHIAKSGPTPAQSNNNAMPKCLSCRDSGTCSWCKSSGVCWMCHNTGKCNNCKGTGLVNGETCSKCKGKGECDSCLGSGECYWCKGSGKCHKCSSK